MARKSLSGSGRTVLLLLLVVCLLLVAAQWYWRGSGVAPGMAATAVAIAAPGGALVGDGLMESPYVPPLKTLDIRGPVVPALVSSSPDGLGLGMAAVPTRLSIPAVVSPSLSMAVPVPVATSTMQMPYRQVGILTHKAEASDNPVILPLMGRSLMNGRDKWQYYTMSNSGGAPISTKLPVSVRGRSGMTEYGVDSLSSGDQVFVDGYQNDFKATIYENASLLY
jgi:hypothetical protein